VVAIAPSRHDDVVAIVSHVPHLTAASLMTLADDRSIEHAALLRLAAGGFRDMTRVASGRPDIWLDICDENRVAIVGALGHLIDELGDVRDAINEGRRDDLRERLGRAREARANLPGRVVHPESLAEVRIPISDRAGAAAEVFVLAADLSVNIANFEVVHAADRNHGIAVVLVDQAHAEVFRGGLLARGFRPSVQALA
jgi:prephenate dehydrogenase